jgi:hypothetical protein
VCNKSISIKGASASLPTKNELTMVGKVFRLFPPLVHLSLEG